VTTYRELVAAATVGLAQRPLTITELAAPAEAYPPALDTSDDAAAVLDAAALLDAAGRAARLTPTQLELPPSAPPDLAPELTTVAGRIVWELLRAGRIDLVSDLLATAAAAGCRSPAPLLPALFNAATRNHGLRPAAAAVAGERGRWLAAQQPEWAHVLDAAPGEMDADVWEIGRPAERRAWLTDLRRRDSDAARQAIVAGWAKETGDGRAGFLTVLAEGLSEADEAFLESALDDRRADVRRAAVALLARLPASAFGQRTRQRAAGLLDIERRALRRRLVVTLPPEPDPATLRDGIDPKPPDKRGERAWLLTQLIAAAPLELWPDALGEHSGELVRLPVSDDFHLEVHAGWRIATLRQRDAAWARALLRAGDDPPPRAGWPSDEALAAVLPEAERQDRAVALLACNHPVAAVPALHACPPPWGSALVTAVLDQVRRAVRAAEPPPLGPLLGLAARRLPIDARLDAEFHRLADIAPITSPLPASLRNAADVLDLRRRFLEELP